MANKDDAAVGKVPPLPVPKIMYSLAVRVGDKRWIDADVFDSLDDALDSIRAALSAGESVMCERIKPWQE